MSDVLQNVAVAVIVLAAFAYLFRHLTGWPRFRKKDPGQAAVLGDRLARGLTKAEEGQRGKK